VLQEEAQNLAVNSLGCLPIPLKLESRAIGAILGEESVRKSVQAGIIGLIVVILFMDSTTALGIIADLALIAACCSLDVIQIDPSHPYPARHCRFYLRNRYGS
jgi:preprotein translocase subunit SecD